MGGTTTTSWYSPGWCRPVWATSKSPLWTASTKSCRSVGSSDAASAGETGIGPVIPLDVFIALEPAPQHRFTIAFPREVEQQRGEPFDLYATGPEVLHIRVEP